MDEECQEFGGRYAECYKAWRKCRCKHNAVPIKISNNVRHCVPLGTGNDWCTLTFLTLVFALHSSFAPQLSILNAVRLDGNKSILQRLQVRMFAWLQT